MYRFTYKPLLYAFAKPALKAEPRLEIAKSRLIIVMGCILMAFTMVIFRLFDLMVMGSVTEDFSTLQAQHAPPAVGRANIVDCNGEILATSVVTASLYANPKEIQDAKEVADKLSQTFPALKQGEILQKIERPSCGFVWIKRHLTPMQQDAVMQWGLPGVHLQRDERRIYTHGPLLSHLLGMTNIDNVGIAGIERSFDQKLKAAPDPLTLTIDMRMQHVVRDELLKGIQQFQANGAIGIIIETQTGAVKAMVSLPDFDPNHPSAAPEELFNKASLGTYEMGSTLKIITLAMAMEHKVADFKTRYDATKPIPVGGHEIHDYHAKNAWLNTAEVFLYSSNIGAARMAMAVGSKKHRSFMQNLGLLNTLNVEISEVGAPIYSRIWRDINTMTIAYGYGLAASPLQLVGSISGLVNDGVMMPLHFTEDNRRKLKPKQVISRNTSHKLCQLMRLNAMEGSTKVMNIKGYEVGFKTGTANVLDRGRYRADKVWTDVVGAFPMHKPRYTFLIMLAQPKGTAETGGHTTASWNCAPITARVIERIALIAGMQPSPEDKMHNEMESLVWATLPYRRKDGPAQLVPASH